MPRWNNNLESNCKDILDNNIKNIKSDLYQQLLLQLLESNIENNKKIIERFLRNALNLVTTLSKHTKEYWVLRGWSDVESYVKSKEHKQINCKSVYSQQTWLEKINPTTKKHYTLEEADFERNSRRPIRKEYWIKQGHPENEAIHLANHTKQQNNKKGSQKGVQDNIRRVTSKRCIEYFTSRGYTIKEATGLVSENQKYFSKKICLQQHGETNGLKIWKKRQENWQATLNAKSPEEKARINRLKLFKGGSVSKGEKLLFEILTFNNIACSKQHAILKSKTNYYVYDIISNNKIIEYNGDYWHANPKKYISDDILKFPGGKQVQAQHIWDKDQKKLQYARDQGYEVLVVWESDFKKNKEMVIKECIQFLTL